MTRTIFLIMFVIGFMLASCQDESHVTNPQQTETQYTVDSEPNWIALPQTDDKRLEKLFLGFDFVHKDFGGEVVIDFEYRARDGHPVKIYSSLKFDPGCVQANGLIFMILDDRSLVSEMKPHQVFNVPAILNQRFEGIDLSYIDDTQPVKYYYLTQSGAYEEMKCDQIIVDKENGILELVNGQIPHFSRYGFAN